MASVQPVRWGDQGVREAMLYDSLPGKRVRCRLCAHNCTIADGDFGLCQARQNREGKLYTLVYGKTIARHVDPVEKKPLFHFHPGSTAYSIATPGCNFRCRWCQNWEISQMPRDERVSLGGDSSPAEIVADARLSGCRSIAYTYTEPTIFFEYAYDTARLAHESGIRNVIVTNGYMTEAMLETFSPVLDAANVDLKAFRDETYRKHIGARLRPVLDSLKLIRQLGIWLEVTMLVVPGLNDDPSELRETAHFIASHLGPDTPWHISRFLPAHQMTDVLPTPLSTLQRARQIGREAGLRYVYLGNVPGEADTHCHNCGRLLIRRSIGGGLENHLAAEARCPDCGSPVAGIGMASPPR